MSAIILSGVAERWQREYLERALAGLFDVCVFTDDVAACEHAAAVRVLSVFVHNHVDTALLELFPNLQMIAARARPATTTLTSNAAARAASSSATCRAMAITRSPNTPSR